MGAGLQATRLRKKGPGKENWDEDAGRQRDMLAELRLAGGRSPERRSGDRPRHHRERIEGDHERTIGRTPEAEARAGRNG